jgi:hypothetical protein
MPSQPSLHASPCRKWLLADLDVLHAQIYSHESERLLWQSRFPAVNADRGKLLSYGYPAVKILARLYLPGSLLCKSQSVSPNRDVRARIMRFLYCPQVPMRVRSFCNETDNLVGRRVWIAWLSLYASHVRGPVSSHFHRWGVNAGDRVTYQRQGQGWNVVSGYTADNRIFYRKISCVVVSNGTTLNLSIPHHINRQWMSLSRARLILSRYRNCAALADRNARPTDLPGPAALKFARWGSTSRPRKRYVSPLIYLVARMSALGQKQTSDWRPLMSALPPKADIRQRDRDVRFVPIADIGPLTF